MQVNPAAFADIIGEVVESKKRRSRHEANEEDGEDGLGNIEYQMVSQSVNGFVTLRVRPNFRTEQGLVASRRLQTIYSPPTRNEFEEEVSDSGYPPSSMLYSRQYDGVRFTVGERDLSVVGPWDILRFAACGNPWNSVPSMTSFRRVYLGFQGRRYGAIVLRANDETCLISRGSDSFYRQVVFLIFFLKKRTNPIEHLKG